MVLISSIYFRLLSLYWILSDLAPTSLFYSAVCLSWYLRVYILLWLFYHASNHSFGFFLSYIYFIRIGGHYCRVKRLEMSYVAVLHDFYYYFGDCISEVILLLNFVNSCIYFVEVFTMGRVIVKLRCIVQMLYPQGKSSGCLLWPLQCFQRVITAEAATASECDQ